uniref:GdcH3 n=1 Tax=Arundo donax TaxID=35708 RepID=A0A0A9ATK8_ARUDO
MNQKHTLAGKHALESSLMSVFLLAVLGVLGRVQQAVRLRRAARLHLYHPPILVRARVDQARRLRQLRIDLDDLAGDRGVHVAGGLHTLHVAKGSSRGDLRAGLRQLHEHHLSKVPLQQLNQVSRFLL